jgi:thiosulfate dehydrogenase (quinone) large subunit
MIKATSGLDSRVLGYTTLRLAVGMAMLVHGAERLGHVSQFANGLVKMFATTWLPGPAVLGFGYLTPPVELAIGLMTLTGLFTRLGLLCGGLWMVALIFGSTLIEQYQTVGIQLVYALIFWVLLHFLEANLLSVDHWLATLRRRSQRR